MTELNVINNVKKILIIDDDRGTRFLLRQTFEQDDYNVTEAENGEEGLQFFKDHRPDIILIDAMMPIIDGITLCSKIRELPEGKYVPILMVTSLDDDKIIEMAYNAGATDFVTKPIQFAILRQRIKRILSITNSEMLLAKSIETADSITKIIKDGIITIDGEDKIKSFNTAAEKIFGYSADEVNNQNINFLIPDFYQYYNEQYAYFTEKKITSPDIEAYGKNKDGRVVAIEFKISGTIGGERLVTIHDMTELKQQENKLQMAYKILENIKEGIILTNNHGVIKMVNQAFTSITGFSEAEAIGQTPIIIKSEQYDINFHRNMISQLKQNGSFKDEVWIKKKSGELCPVSAFISVINETLNEKEQYITIFYDITDEMKLKAKNEALQMQAGQVQKIAILSTISAGIIHEINQPLNSIKILTDGLLYWHNQGNTLEIPRVVGAFEKILQQLARVEEIIKQMRAFTNIKQSQEVSNCNLNRVVLKTIELIGVQLANHNVIVKKAFAENLPDISGNFNILEEVVINLIINAMQALNETKQTEKEVICKTYLNDENKVVLEVSDNGPGIKDDIKEKIFEPFFSTKPDKGGMGLGLSLVKSILTSYNSSISISNNSKGGATFKVEIPSTTPVNN
ncbi:MAG: PAS domain S-box protein [Candidatus Wallbacteria bacterium]